MEASLSARADRLASERQKTKTTKGMGTINSFDRLEHGLMIGAFIPIDSLTRIRDDPPQQKPA